MLEYLTIKSSSDRSKEWSRDKNIKEIDTLIFLNKDKFEVENYLHGNDKFMPTFDESVEQEEEKSFKEVFEKLYRRSTLIEKDKTKTLFEVVLRDIIKNVQEVAKNIDYDEKEEVEIVEINTTKEEYYKSLSPEEKKFYDGLSREEKDWYLEIGTTEIGEKIVEGMKTNIEKMKSITKELKSFNRKYNLFNI